MRWENQTACAAEHLGWSVVETDGVNDYQGWGVHLLKHQDGNWGVLHWSYGSCSGCDPYEDQCPYDATSAQCAEIFGDLIEVVAMEEDARQLYSDRKGW